MRKDLKRRGFSDEKIESIIDGMRHPSPTPPTAPGGSLPLGMRTNNPGNLQPNGESASFFTPEEGMIAMAKNLQKYGKRGWNSIDSIINHWSPANGKGNSEESTEAYKQTVERLSGFNRKETLDLTDQRVLERLMAPMIKQEQGYEPFSKEQISSAANKSVSLTITNNFNGADDAQEHAGVVNQQVIDTVSNVTNNGAAW